MWRTAFTAGDFGLGSAIAVFLFVLVIPVLLLNVRRFRRESLMAAAAPAVEVAKPRDERRGADRPRGDEGAA